MCTLWGGSHQQFRMLWLYARVNALPQKCLLISLYSSDVVIRVSMGSSTWFEALELKTNA
jgi:hypothetical protein